MLSDQRNGKSVTLESPVEDATEPLDPHEEVQSVVQRQPSRNNDCNEVTHVTEPSAPPDELDLDVVPRLPPAYQRVASQPAEMRPHPSSSHGQRHAYYRSESDNFEERRLQTLQSGHEPRNEPPPSYDDHHEHPLYQPDMETNQERSHWF